MSRGAAMQYTVPEGACTQRLRACARPARWRQRDSLSQRACCGADLEEEDVGALYVVSSAPEGDSVARFAVGAAAAAEDSKHAPDNRAATQGRSGGYTVPAVPAAAAAAARGAPRVAPAPSAPGSPESLSPPSSSGGAPPRAVKRPKPTPLTSRMRGKTMPYLFVKPPPPTARARCLALLRGWLLGIAPALLEFAMNPAWRRLYRYRVADFVLNALLRGVGQVYFMDNAATGLVMLVAAGLASPPAYAALAVVGLVSQNLGAKFMGLAPLALRNGLFGCVRPLAVTLLCVCVHACIVVACCFGWWFGTGGGGMVVWYGRGGTGACLSS